MIVRAFNPGFEPSSALYELAARDSTRLGDYFNASLRLVAEQQGEIIGFAALKVGTGPCSHCGTLRIHVSSAWRGGGAGDALIDTVLNWAELERVCRIEATPYAHGDILGKIRFFQRHGFVVEGWKRLAGRLADDTLVDTVLMARVA